MSAGATLLWLCVLATLKATTYGHQWVSSTSFSNQDGYNNDVHFYRPPVYYDYDDGNDDSTENSIPPPDPPYLHPFHPLFNPTAPQNDVLVIVLQEAANCSTNSKNQTATVEPPSPPQAQAAPKFVPPPSKCIWAIVACCAPTTINYRYSCFHYLGCSGPFWQLNPCQVPILMLATYEALAYYKQFEPTIGPTNTPGSPVNGTNSTVPVAPTSTTTVNTVAEAPPTTAQPA